MVITIRVECRTASDTFSRSTAAEPGLVRFLMNLRSDIVRFVRYSRGWMSNGERLSEQLFEEEI